MSEKERDIIYDTAEDPYEEETYYANAAPAAKALEEKLCVTKRILIACMVMTLIVSSAISVGVSAFCISRYGNSVSDSSNDQYEETSAAMNGAAVNEMSIADIIDKNEDAVVEVFVSGTSRNMWGQSQVTEGAGSGVIIDPAGYIVTNHHVISGADTIQVTLHNGESYPAALVGSVSERDIAVIKIQADNLTAAEIGDSDTVNEGDTVVAIGNPLGQLGGTATSGIISAMDRELDIEGTTLHLFQTDAAVNGGNSGGGLFNSRGELIGIVDAKSSGVGIEGLAFAIPINSVKDIISDLVEKGAVSGKPSIGISIVNVTEENAQYYGLESAGVYVAEVTGENAQKAGFLEKDRIIAFNGDEIESSDDLISKVRACKAGDLVTLIVSRSGQAIEIRTELEEAIING